MKIHQKTLPNSLRLQGVEMPGAQSITTMILAKAGSRHEAPKENGLSHFLEHLFFKGSEKYPTPKEVSKAVDAFGGHFNAFTGKEYAGYFIKCGAPFLGNVLGVLSDMMLTPRFPPDEIEKERGVILEEMAMYQDAPMYQVSWDFEKALFGDQPLGRDQIGTRDNVLRFSRDEVMAYKEAHYRPSNMVITLAGAVDKETLELVEDYFGGLEEGETPSWTAFDPGVSIQNIHLRPKKTEQYHLSFGFPAFSEKDSRYPTLRILRTILGGNMSSRMFQHVREQKGLCYSIRTYSEGFTDTGLITTQAGVKLSDLPQALEAIAHEYQLIADQGITQEELQMAQNYLIGRLDLGIEDTEHVAQDFAQDLLLYNTVEPYEDWKARLKKVDHVSVGDLASELFKKEKATLAVIGPNVEEKKLLSVIQ